MYVCECVRHGWCHFCTLLATAATFYVPSPAGCRHKMVAWMTVYDCVPFKCIYGRTETVCELISICFYAWTWNIVYALVNSQGSLALCVCVNERCAMCGSTSNRVPWFWKRLKNITTSVIVVRLCCCRFGIFHSIMCVTARPLHARSWWYAIRMERSLKTQHSFISCPRHFEDEPKSFEFIWRCIFDQLKMEHCCKPLPPPPPSPSLTTMTLAVATTATQKRSGIIFVNRNVAAINKHRDDDGLHRTGEQANRLRRPNVIYRADKRQQLCRESCHKFRHGNYANSLSHYEE